MWNPVRKQQLSEYVKQEFMQQLLSAWHLTVRAHVNCILAHAVCAPLMSLRRISVVRAVALDAIELIPGVLFKVNNRRTILTHNQEILCLT